MNSCPKCGSVTVILNEKKGHCGHCNHSGHRNSFLGLSGKFVKPEETAPKVWIQGGAMKTPIFEEDQDYD